MPDQNEEVALAEQIIKIVLPRFFYTPFRTGLSEEILLQSIETGSGYRHKITALLL